MEITAIIIAIFFFVLGIIGTIIPGMPGPFFVFTGMVLYGLMTDFAGLTVLFFIFQGIGVLLVFTVDYVAAGIGTKKFGGSPYAIWGAIIGLLLGIFTPGFVGILIGPFIGAFLGEIIKGLPADKALRSGFGTIAGLAGGLFVKFFIEAVMIGWFFYAILT